MRTDARPVGGPACVNTQDEFVECPCYRVCAGLGLEMKRWCRYRKSDLPPPGLWVLNRTREWCPTGVQASTLLLGYMLVEGNDSEALRLALARVQQWAQELRAADATAG